MDHAALPTPLYHYTGAQGLLGIFTSQTLWATNIQYLNDSQEFDYATEVAKRVIVPRADAALDPKEKEALMALVAPRRRMFPIGVFVASFSTEGDLLSQWRGYCPNGAGYSIGFRANDLKDIVSWRGFWLEPCLYNDADQRQAIERALNELMESPDWINALANLGRNYPYETAVEAWHSRLVRLAPTIKHPMFHEEQEWRLISKLVREDDSALCFRAGRSMLIPYIEMSLAASTGDIPVEKIIVGPTPRMRLAMRAVGSFLNSKGLAFTIQNSKIPHVTW
jgi:hypothetical protein